MKTLFIDPHFWTELMFVWTVFSWFHWIVDYSKIFVSIIHQIERFEVRNSNHFLERGSPSPLSRPIPALSRASPSIRAFPDSDPYFRWMVAALPSGCNLQMFMSYIRWKKAQKFCVRTQNCAKKSLTTNINICVQNFPGGTIDTPSTTMYNMGWDSREGPHLDILTRGPRIPKTPLTKLHNFKLEFSNVNGGGVHWDPFIAPFWAVSGFAFESWVHFSEFTPTCLTWWKFVIWKWKLSRDWLKWNMVSICAQDRQSWFYETMSRDRTHISSIDPGLNSNKSSEVQLHDIGSAWTDCTRCHNGITRFVSIYTFSMDLHTLLNIPISRSAVLPPTTR